MEAGLWIYGTDGTTVLFGPGTSNVTVLGITDTGIYNGSITHPLFARGRPVVVSALPTSGSNWRVPEITISASGIAWAFNVNGASYNQPCRIAYGVRA